MVECVSLDTGMTWGGGGGRGDVPADIPTLKSIEVRIRGFERREILP